MLHRLFLACIAAILAMPVAEAADSSAERRSEVIKKVLSIATPAPEERTFYRWQSTTSGNNLVRAGAFTPDLYKHFMTMQIDNAHFAMGRGLYVAEDMTSSAQFLRDLADGTLIEVRLAKGAPLLDLTDPAVMRKLGELGITREEVRLLDPPVHVKYTSEWWALKSVEGVRFSELENSAHRLGMIQEAIGALGSDDRLAVRILQDHQARIANPERLRQLLAQDPEKAVLAMSDELLVQAMREDSTLSTSLMKVASTFKTSPAKDRLFRTLRALGEPVFKIIASVHPSDPKIFENLAHEIESDLRQGKLKPSAAVSWLLEVPPTGSLREVYRLCTPEILSRWSQLSPTQQYHGLTAIASAPRDARARRALELLARKDLTDPQRWNVTRIAFDAKASAADVLKTCSNLDQLKSTLTTYQSALPKSGSARTAALADLIPLIQQLPDAAMSSQIAEVVAADPSLRLAVLKRSRHLPSLITGIVGQLRGSDVQLPGSEALLKEIAREHPKSAASVRKLLFEHGSKPSEVLLENPDLFLQYSYDRKPVQAIVRAMDKDPDFMAALLKNSKYLDSSVAQVADAAFDRGVPGKVVLQSFDWVSDKTRDQILAGFVADIQKGKMTVADLVPWIFEYPIPVAHVPKYRTLLESHIVEVINNPKVSWPQLRGAVALLEKHPNRDWARALVMKAYRFAAENPEWTAMSGYSRQHLTLAALGNGAKSIDLLPLVRSEEEAKIALETYMKGVAAAPPENRLERLSRLVPFLNGHHYVQRGVAPLLAQEPELAHQVLLSKSAPPNDQFQALKSMSPEGARPTAVRKKLVEMMKLGPEVTDVSFYAGRAFIRGAGDASEVPDALVRRLLARSQGDFTEDQTLALLNRKRDSLIKDMKLIANSSNETDQLREVMLRMGGWNGINQGEDMKALREVARKLAKGDVWSALRDVPFPSNKAREVAELWAKLYGETLPKAEYETLLAQVNDPSYHPPAAAGRAESCAGMWARLRGSLLGSTGL